MKNNEENISGLVNTNEKFRLINQLCERQVRRLTEENQSLRERVRALTTDNDEHRLKLLLADKERRRLVKWKAMANKTVHFLKNSVQEFEEFANEIEKGIAEVEKKGAIRTDFECAVQRRKTSEFARNLTRIVESPLLLNSTTTVLGDAPEYAAASARNNGDVQPVKNNTATATATANPEHTKDAELNVTYVVQRSDDTEMMEHNDNMGLTEMDEEEFVTHCVGAEFDEPMERTATDGEDQEEISGVSNPTATRHLTDDVFYSSSMFNKIAHSNDISVSSFHGKRAPLFTSTPKDRSGTSHSVVKEFPNTPISSTLRYVRRSHIPVYSKRGVNKRRESFRIDFVDCSDLRDQLAASIDTPKERTLTPRPECGETKIPTPRLTKKKTAKKIVAQLNDEEEAEVLNDDVQTNNKVRLQPTRSCKRTSTMSVAGSVTNTRKTRSKRK